MDREALAKMIASHISCGPDCTHDPIPMQDDYDLADRIIAGHICHCCDENT